MTLTDLYKKLGDMADQRYNHSRRLTQSQGGYCDDEIRPTEKEIAAVREQCATLEAITPDAQKIYFDVLGAQFMACQHPAEHVRTVTRHFGNEMPAEEVFECDLCGETVGAPIVEIPF